jgi:hypothetical protein
MDINDLGEGEEIDAPFVFNEAMHIEMLENQGADYQNVFFQGGDEGEY